MRSLTTEQTWRRDMNHETPLNDAILSYLRSKRRISDHTRAWYLTYLSAYAEWLSRNQRDVVVASIRPDYVEAFLSEYRQRPTRKYSSGSAFSERAAAVTLKTFSNWLARNAILSTERGTSVLAGVENAKVDDDVRQPLTREQISQLIERAGPRGSLERAVVMFMLGTGVRLNEAREARAADMDLDSCTFTVRPETSKFGRSRVTYFHREVAAELDYYLRERDDRSQDDPTAPLFPNASGRMYNADGWAKLFQRLRRRSGILDFSAHRLRHTWATEFMRAGGDLLDLKRQGGWRKWEMVERYSHAVPPLHRDRLPNPIAMKAPSVKRPFGPPFHKTAVA